MSAPALTSASAAISRQIEHMHAPGHTIGDHFRLAGGPKRGGDNTSVFVLSANGSVNSSRQASSWLSRDNQFAGLGVEPGDTTFVPEEMDKSTWLRSATYWSPIPHQPGLSFAGIASAIK